MALLLSTDGGQHNARIIDGAVLTLTARDRCERDLDLRGRVRRNRDGDPRLGHPRIGPSVAINAVKHTTLAEIGNAHIVGANNINVTANGTYTTHTVSEAGANNDGSLPAAIALTATSNDTIARLTPGTLRAASPAT